MSVSKLQIQWIYLVAEFAVIRLCSGGDDEIVVGNELFGFYYDNDETIKKKWCITF